MNVQDGIFLGPPSINVVGTNNQSVFGIRPGADDPTSQMGAGPAGRIFFLNITPATLNAANLAALQASTINVPLVLAAGAGVTKIADPLGTGLQIFLLDVNRCVSLTSAANLSAVNYTLVGYDIYGRKQTSTIAGPNINTVIFPKAMLAVISITPSATNAGTVSAGTADKFGFQFAVPDASYIQSVKGNNTLASDAGTFVAADLTNPATAATGDPRGTYAPSFASNGARRLTIGFHLDETQCGPFATMGPSTANLYGLIGVTPV
jgi:hypothetical protein